MGVVAAGVAAARAVEDNCCLFLSQMRCAYMRCIALLQTRTGTRLLRRALRPLVWQQHRHARPQQQQLAVAAAAKEPVAAREHRASMVLEQQVEAGAPRLACKRM